MVRRRNSHRHRLRRGEGGRPGDGPAPFLSLEESVYAAVIDAYEHTRGTGIDDAMYSRMLLMSELAIPRWLMHGVRTNNESIQKEARSMLDDLSKQVAEAES